eukprot:5123802-Ditylum_brightwellii.AAC.1
MSLTTTLRQLSEYFQLKTVGYLIDHHKEQNASDAGHGNMFLIRKLDQLSNNKGRKNGLLYLAMKDLLPYSVSDLRNDLFLVPPTNQKLLHNGVPGCHQ